MQRDLTGTRNVGLRPADPPTGPLGKGADGVKLSDPTKGLSGGALERLWLEEESLGGYRKFWEQAAVVDAVHAIADQETATSFEVSGTTDADALWEVLPDSEAVVLEIGCGIGRVMQHLAGRYREVRGIDISAEMVTQGRRRLGHLPNLHFHHGNGYDLEPFADVSFDLVYSGFAFQHMPKTVAYNYFLETRRVLRPGGLFSFQLPNLLRETHFAQFNHFAQPWFVQHPYPMCFWTPVEVVWLLSRAGLWVEALDEQMVVLARKTQAPGAVAEQFQASIDSELAGLTSSGRIAELDRQVMELERQLDRFRRHPIIRLALAARRAIRRPRRPADRQTPAT
jgi:ubiquinone/menaquinone biosynthesis C-methylase UbiE